MHNEIDGDGGGRAGRHCAPAGLQPRSDLGRNRNAGIQSGRALQSEELFVPALTTWDKFLHDFPNDGRAAKACYNRGFCLFQTKQFDKAQDALRKVIEKLSPRGTARRRLPLPGHGSIQPRPAGKVRDLRHGRADVRHSGPKIPPEQVSPRGPLLPRRVSLSAGEEGGGGPSPTPSWPPSTLPTGWPPRPSTWPVSPPWRRATTRPRYGTPRLSSPRIPTTNLAADVMHVAAESQLLLGHFPESERTYGQLLEKYPNHVDVSLWRVRHAMALYLQKKYQQTIDSLDPAAGSIRAPELACEAQFLLGSSRLELKQPEAAAKALEAAMAADPKWRRADETRLALAAAYRQAGQLDQARANLRRLIADFPASPLLEQAHDRLGECCYLAGDYRSAAEAYQTLVARWPQSPLAPQALYALAAAELDQKNLVAAERSLDSALGEVPRGEAGRPRTFPAGAGAVPGPQVRRGGGRLAVGPGRRPFGQGEVRRPLPAGPLPDGTETVSARRRRVRRASSAGPAIRSGGYGPVSVGLGPVPRRRRRQGRRGLRTDLEKIPAESSGGRGGIQCGGVGHEGERLRQGPAPLLRGPREGRQNGVGGKGALQTRLVLLPARRLRQCRAKLPVPALRFSTRPVGWPVRLSRGREPLPRREVCRGPDGLRALEKLPLSPTSRPRPCSTPPSPPAGSRNGKSRWIGPRNVCGSSPPCPRRRRRLFQQGWAQQSLGKTAEALALYQQTIDRAPNQEVAARAQFQIGKLQFDQKQYGEASQSFVKVVYGYSFPRWQAEAAFASAGVYEAQGKKRGPEGVPRPDPGLSPE